MELIGELGAIPLDEANALLIKIAEIAHSLPIMETAGSGTPIN